MAFDRSVSNRIFGGVAAVLALTAVIGLYLAARQPALLPAPKQPRPETGPGPVGQDPARQNVALESSIANLERMIAATPDNAEYHAQIAGLYLDIGRFNDAIAHYRQSLELEPGNPNVATDLAACYHYIGMDDEALEILERVTADHPDFSQAKFNKGVVLIYGKNDTDRGLAVWEDLLRSDPGFQHSDELQQRIRYVRQAVRSPG